MKQRFALTLALAVGLTAAAHAQAVGRTTGGDRSRGRTFGVGITVALAPNPPAPEPVVGAEAVPSLPEGTPVVVVGQITSALKAILREHKAEVIIGPAKVPFTLHLSGATIYDDQGAVIKPNKLPENMWVRVEGTVMNDPRRIKVKRLQVIGKDAASLRQSAFYRLGLEQGYIFAVAGSYATYPVPTGVVVSPPPVTLVGKVVEDTGPLDAARTIRVEAAGSTRTLEVPKDSPVVDVRGRPISIHHVAQGQWVRVHGWQVGDLTVRVARIQEIGPDEAYGASTFYRPGEPLGYVERESGSDVSFRPIRIAGVVTAVDLTAGTVTVRDETGQDHDLPLAGVTIRAKDREVDVAKLQPGEEVTVEGTEITFQQARAE